MSAGGVADPTSDAQLLGAHVDGDPDAFAEIVRRHQHRLWTLALRTLRNPEDASDALQDALLSAYRNAGSYRGEAQVSTWLYRVVMNACLDRLRRAKARPAVPLPEHDLPARGDAYAQTEARLVLDAALASLPEHQRTAIVLVDLHELTVAEAARVLGVAEGTVKSRCSRGRAMLGELLTADAADAADAADPAAPGNRRPGSRVRATGTHTPLRGERS